jgi:hypothetical protein
MKPHIWVGGDIEFETFNGSVCNTLNVWGYFKMCVSYGTFSGGTECYEGYRIEFRISHCDNDSCSLLFYTLDPEDLPTINDESSAVKWLFKFLPSDRIMKVLENMFDSAFYRGQESFKRKIMDLLTQEEVE